MLGELLQSLTVAVVGTFMSASSVVVNHVLTRSDDILGAASVGQLAVTPADVAFAFLHLPLLKTPHCNVFAYEHIESGIDMLKHVITNKDNGIKALKNHADLRSRVPAIMASSWEEGCIESMAATAIHGSQKACTIMTVGRLLLAIHSRSAWGTIQISGCEAALLMPFEVVEVA